jgi:Flp pilus assembly protein TadD
MAQQSFTIAPAAFDAKLLPAGARTPGTPAFREAVNTFLQQAFEGFGGRATFVVDDERISVTWNPDPARPSPLKAIGILLQQGRQSEAIQLLELLLSHQPHNVQLLYNLGMALSDAGLLPQAEKHLRRAIELKHSFCSALVALGVALARQGKSEEAVKTLECALASEPDNFYAHQNLGALFLKLAQFEKAIDHLRGAVALQPADQQSWVSLGHALSQSGRADEAGEAYAQAIRINPHTDIAEQARQESSGLAQQTFAHGGAGAPRVEAVQHCLAALKTFAPLTNAEIKRITGEIAMTGRNGFDINKGEKRYTLKLMPGEYSGLQLLCYLYVGFQIIAPGTSIGFDLEKEYHAALALFQGNKP